MKTMDFESFNRGVYSLMVSVSVAIGGAFTPLSASTDKLVLLQPEIIEEVNSKIPEDYNFQPPQKNIATETVSDNASEAINNPHEATSDAVVTVKLPVKAKKKISPSLKLESKKGQIKPELKKEAKESPKMSPSPVSAEQKHSANGEKLFQMINDHRKTLGLASFEKDNRICLIATTRAPQIYDEVFGEGPIHQGFKSLNLPYWATENAASYETIEQNLHFWLSDTIHKKAIEGDSKYSCLECSGTSCSQIFTSFIVRAQYPLP